MSWDVRDQDMLNQSCPGKRKFVTGAQSGYVAEMPWCDA